MGGKGGGGVPGECWAAKKWHVEAERLSWTQYGYERAGGGAWQMVGGSLQRESAGPERAGQMVSG